MEQSIEEIIEELRRRKKALAHDDLLKLMTAAGAHIRTTREGCLIRHPSVHDFVASVAKPHGKRSGNAVKLPYVKNCITLLERALKG